jgi:hypothetical protein
MKLVSDHCAFESDCQNLKRVLNENEEQIKYFGSIVVNNIKRNIRSLFLFFLVMWVGWVIKRLI